MAHSRTIRIAALNVAMHSPHSPARYAELLRDAYGLQRLCKQGSLHAAVLGALTVKGDAAQPDISGEIYRFVNIDPDEPWFNMRTRAPATQAEASEVRIPKNLLAHLKRIPFVFMPESHRLWFISQDRHEQLGPSTAERFFQDLFDQPELVEKYATVEVTALPQSDSLEKLLSIHTLSRLIIEVKRPNADDAAVEEAKVLRRLEAQKARRSVTQLVADRNQSIEPDAETKALAQVAANGNGRVTIVGRSASGERVEDSTSNRPMIRSELVDTNVETAMDVLRRTAASHL